MKKTKMLTAVLIVMALMSIMTVYSFAADIFKEKWSEDRTAEYLATICTVGQDGKIQLNKKIENIIKADPSDDNDTINVEIKLDKADDDYSVEISTTAWNKLVTLGKEIYDKESIKNRVSGIGENFDISADTEGAGQVLSGLQPLVARVVGIIFYLIVLGAGLFTALDLVYITMPVFRNVVEEQKQSGQGVFAGQDKKTGQTKVRFITDEAQYAVMHCNVESGKSPIGIYIVKRIWAYIMIGLVIYILATGRVSLIVNIAINLVSGIIEGLSALGQ